ncbi:MAG: sporulation transcriptional regulator SpoIIID [Eubacterium sp.]
MKNDVDRRCIMLGEYICDTKSTVRQAAKEFGISKSTVHIDVTKRLSKISPTLAKQVNEILQENKAVRHIRGGKATKEKYQKIKTVDIYK